MPIENFPFSIIARGIARPYLPVNIINSHNDKKNYSTWGIIDTGADVCAISARFAKILGHDLKSVKPKDVFTGNGLTLAYPHSTRFEILHPITGQIIYTTEDTPVDFLPELDAAVLLGVNNFLGKFILNINYPQQKFSITDPSRIVKSRV